jgi:hypothetical protein
MVSATGFEPANNGFAESLNVSNYLKEQELNFERLLIYFCILQPIRNHFLWFATPLRLFWDSVSIYNTASVYEKTKRDIGGGVK